MTRTTRTTGLPLILALTISLGAATLAGTGPAAAKPAAQADTPTATPTETPTPTDTPVPPTSTPTSSGFSRPVIVLSSYSTGGDVAAGDSFVLKFRLRNAGDVKARNLIISIVAGDFIPSGTGGVIAAGALAAGADSGYSQPLTADGSLVADTVSALQIQVSYTDPGDNSYTETFTLSIPIGKASSEGGSVVRPTSTPTPGVRPQLLITGYSVDHPVLKPGARFTLSLDIMNVGGLAAKGVSLIVGGGTQSGGGSGATPPADMSGGISGAAGDFANFAPVGSSNIQYLGDFAVGGNLTASQSLIVNSSTKPGAYPLKVSFVYRDDRNSSYTDDQVVTLLVYAPPVLEVSFYRAPEPFFVGQPGMLPVQVVNLDRNMVILGRMAITAATAELTNNVSPIGLLDAGGYFTLDANLTPQQPGPLDVTVTIDYLDDFNQPQRISQELTVEVGESPDLGPTEGGFPGEGSPEAMPPESEGFWEKAWRFILGLLGLDSGRSGPEAVPPPGEMGPEGYPPSGPVVVPGPKG